LLGGELSPAVPPDELATIAAQLAMHGPEGPGRSPEQSGLGPEGPRASMAVMPMLGHFGPFQAPDVIADDIANWAA
jgi:hypothetical protein